MQKMKSLALILLMAVSLVSCSEYQKVLNKGKNSERYKLAEELYKKGDYKKAIPLFEKLTGPYAGKPQMERIQYMIADSYFQNKDYSLSSYYFSKFISNYPKSSKVEEAAFLSAYSSYLQAPKFSLDQTDTYKALEALQSYINNYPNSTRISDANKYFDLLTRKLEKKDFETARQYYHTEYYKAAMVAFDIFNEEHLGSIYKEDAIYFKFKAAHDLAINSVLSKKRKRLLDAKEIYVKFKKEFPESERLKEMDNLMKDVNRELEELQQQILQIEAQK
jgi:outer membrane protein assembly factor BamD